MPQVILIPSRDLSRAGNHADTYFGHIHFLLFDDGSCRSDICPDLHLADSADRYYLLVVLQKERKVWREHEAESDRLNNMVQENLNGIRVVSAFANEQFEIERFRKQNERKRAIAFRHSQLHAFFWPLSDYLGFAQIVLSIVVGGYFAIEGRITLVRAIEFHHLYRHGCLAYASIRTLALHRPVWL